MALRVAAVMINVKTLHYAVFKKTATTNMEIWSNLTTTSERLCSGCRSVSLSEGVAALCVNV
uniref:AlNc14C238G9437 protein n=1 Tax=Albugo laibachii Nc14 TaxID=890382 RepID=F0WSU1_9STRA|nr:AlNc14C238G9437 [Albugo laibachii Nc14]|eukprot:CCA24419.1 AlNc14C238G9437 [Albugo laibachii Nc14]